MISSFTLKSCAVSRESSERITILLFIVICGTKVWSTPAPTVPLPAQTYQNRLCLFNTCRFPLTRLFCGVPLNLTQQKRPKQDRSLKTVCLSAGDADASRNTTHCDLGEQESSNIFSRPFTVPNSFGGNMGIRSLAATYWKDSLKSLPQQAALQSIDLHPAAGSVLKCKYGRLSLSVLEYWERPFDSLVDHVL